MEVGVEKGHLDICDALAKEVNKLVRNFSPKSYRIKPDKYEKLLGNKSLTIATKKKKLLAALKEVTLKTLSIDSHKTSSPGQVLDDLKLNIRLVRALIFKLRSINYYLEDVFLSEIGLKEKPKNWKQMLNKGVKSLKEKTFLGKKDLESMEHTVYKALARIITLDEKLLNAYKKKEIKIVKDEQLGIRDLEDLLGRESELLMHMEAKFPPPDKVKEDLLDHKRFSHWMSRVLMGLSAFEHACTKEDKIFQKLKQSARLRKKVEARIDYILREKFELMQLKEQRVLSWDHPGDVDEALHDAAHRYLAASQL